MPRPKVHFAVQLKLSATDWVWYHKVTKFKELYKWLDKNKKGWRFGNVYYKGQQIGSFTNRDRPDNFYPPY